MEPIVYLNGAFVPLSQAKVSILDRGFCYGDALFETMRVYSGKIFHLNLHLDRLERGAHRIYMELPESRDRIQEILYETFNRNQGENAVIRLTITRGEGVFGKLWQAETTPTLSVHVRSYSSPPDEWYQNGIPISLIPNSAAKLGDSKEQIKSANYLSQILARKRAEEQNSVDGIMINEQGEVCDGTISNIFAVKNGELSTPAVNGYVLAGANDWTGHDGDFLIQRIGISGDVKWAKAIDTAYRDSAIKAIKANLSDHGAWIWVTFFALNVPAK